MKSLNSPAGWHNLSTYLTINGALREFSLRKHAKGVDSADHLAEVIRDYAEYHIAKLNKGQKDFRWMSRILSETDFAQIARFMLKHKEPIKKPKTKKAAA